MDELSVTIGEYQYTNRPKCRKSCAQRSVCGMKSVVKRLKSANEPWIYLSVFVENGSDRPISLRSDGWELVDAGGFSVGGMPVCEQMLPRDYVQADMWRISPGTRIRTQIMFPASRRVPVELIYDDGERAVRARILFFGSESLDISHSNLPEKQTVRAGKKRKVILEDCWRCRDADGKERFVFIGRKK